jgi:hypothetical protein
VIEHRARTADIAIEYGMKGTARGVIGAENPVAYRTVAHGAFRYKAVRIEDKEIPARNIVGHPAAIDRRNKFYPLFNDLRRGRDGRVPAVGEKRFRFEPC